MHRLDGEGRSATEEDKRALVKYVGWGGIPQVFAWHEAPDWQSERERLKVLLSAEEYEAARASTLNAHYTAPVVVSAIYDAVERLGFKHGRVLEPAAGIGHFFGLMPADMSLELRDPPDHQRRERRTQLQNSEFKERGARLPLLCQLSSPHPFLLRS